ncbi:MAG: hypothetical protein HQK96_19425 [Nitrospirae bacterium]|nr:hypothetical protein [Nitrospirota bacterium]
MYYRKENNLKKIFTDLLPFSIAITIYIVIYMGFRYEFTSQYQGNVINTGANYFTGFVVCLLRYSLDAVPGVLFFTNSYSVIANMDAYNSFYHSMQFVSFNSLSSLSSLPWVVIINVYLWLTFLIDNFKHLKPEWFIRGAILIYSLYMIFYAKIQIRKRTLIYLVLIGLSLLFLPNLPHALTPKYQEWALHGSSSYVGTYFSFFGVVMLSSILLAVIPHLFRRFPSIQKGIMFLLAVVLFALSLTVSIVNDVMVASKTMVHNKWEIMEDFFRTDEFARLKDNSIIYAPTLYKPQFILVSNIMPNYWSDYIMYKTGKRIIVVMTPEQYYTEVHERKPNVTYALIYNQEFDTANQYIVFSEIENTAFGPNNSDMALFSGNFMLLPMTLYSEGNLSFQTTGAADALSNNKIPLFSRQGVFTYRVKTKTRRLKDRIERIASKGIYLNSVFLTNNINYQPYVDVTKFNKHITFEYVKGFYDEEKNGQDVWRWSSKEGVIKINNLDVNPHDAVIRMTMTLFHKNNYNVSITLNKELLANVSISNSAGKTIESKIKLAPGENILKFETDAPVFHPLNGDTRSLFFGIWNLSIEEKDGFSM